MSSSIVPHSIIRAPLFKDDRATLERIEKFISKDHFVDCNLRGRLYGETCAISMVHVDFGLTRPNFEEAKSKLIEQGKPVTCGFTFGPTWSTHWFRLTIEMPGHWSSKTIEMPGHWSSKTVRIRFDAGCEAMFWSENGHPLQGLSPDFDRTDLLLPYGQSIPKILYVEAAANNRQGNGDGGMIEPSNPNCNFTIKRCELAIFKQGIFNLIMDFEMLYGMADRLPKDGTRRYNAMFTANDMINQLVMNDFSIESQADAHHKARALFEQYNGDARFTLHAIGNCHIDTAWLWPYAETKRKCVRSWTAALRLIDRYPGLNFVVSQAQQLVWLRQLYPSVYDEIRSRAAEGRFNGVGGAWIEMDGNMPSGESMIRQLLYGQREFKTMLGSTSTVFWLPDTFGYSAQMPQIMSHCGMHRFVTQKMSWSFVNKFPHHSFWWIGIDGTKVLAHFPPKDYVSQMTFGECLDSISNYTDRGRSAHAMLLYGHGDGGGGPDEQMMERMLRMASYDEPKVQSATPESFFEQLEKDGDNLCKWDGELFLELHNATYTTQALIKKNNRFCEFLLRDQEFLQAARLVSGCKFYRLNSQWQRVLLNQFHDVLPGTSIHEAIADALEIYEDVKRELLAAEDVLRVDLEEKTGSNSGQKDAASWVVNSLPWPRTIFHRNQLFTVPSSSIIPMEQLQPLESVKNYVRCEKVDDTVIIENRYLKAEVLLDGRIRSLKTRTIEDGNDWIEFCSADSKQLLNQFVIFHDVPLYWDAWDCMDYHLETRQSIDQIKSKVDMIIQNDNICEMEFQLQISPSSSIHQVISLRADQPYLTFTTSVDWHESHRFLKVEFPTNLKATEAIYDIQFGHVKRPAHRNTSWDAAKYEVCGHKWAAICEYDQGLAVLNDCKYGHSCEGGMLRLSLLRASKAPDRTADMGQHTFNYAIFPFISTWQQPKSCDTNVLRAAYEFNCPPRFVNSNPGQSELHNWITIENASGVIIDTVKPAEDDDHSLVVRMFEAFGGKAMNARLMLRNVAIVSVKECDGLEQAIGEEIEISDSSVRLSFRPFQIRSLLIKTK